MLKDQNPLLHETKPKCLISSPNFDAYSTETDTPKNEAVNSGGSSNGLAEGKVFKFPAMDESSSSSPSGSKRNSIRNEERPIVDVSLSNLMLCHFG